MKTFETEKHNIPEGATHYQNECSRRSFAWFRGFTDYTVQIMTANGRIWHDVEARKYIERAIPIPQTNIETPEEKEALDLTDTTSHQYEMSKFSGNNPRTKVEYVKCEFESMWEAVKAFEGGEVFHTHFMTDGWVIVEHVQQVIPNLQVEKLYRRIETPITEREAFCTVYHKVREEFNSQYEVESFYNFLYDSGNFKLVESD